MLLLSLVRLALALMFYCHFVLAGYEQNKLIEIDKYVCLSVCLSARISPEPHGRSLPNSLCMLPMSVARSSFDTFTVGRIACHREGVFFPTENALLVGKGGWECTARGKVCYLRLPCCSMLSFHGSL